MARCAFDADGKPNVGGPRARFLYLSWVAEGMQFTLASFKEIASWYGVRPYLVKAAVLFMEREIAAFRDTHNTRYSTATRMRCPQCGGRAVKIVHQSGRFRDACENGCTRVTKEEP